MRTEACVGLHANAATRRAVLLTCTAHDATLRRCAGLILPEGEAAADGAAPGVDRQRSLVATQRMRNSRAIADTFVNV